MITVSWCIAVLVTVLLPEGRACMLPMHFVWCNRSVWNFNKRKFLFREIGNPQVNVSKPAPYGGTELTRYAHEDDTFFVVATIALPCCCFSIEHNYAGNSQYWRLRCNSFILCFEVFALPDCLMHGWYRCHMWHCKFSEHNWDQCVYRRAETFSKPYKRWWCIAEAHAFAGQCQLHTMRLGSSWWMLSSAITLFPRTWQSMLWATVSISPYPHSYRQSASCMLHGNYIPQSTAKQSLDCDATLSAAEL